MALLRIYKQLGTIITKKQLRGSIIVFFSMVLCSGLELLGVSAIYPFLLSMSDMDSIKDEWYVKIITSVFPNTSNIVIIVLIGLVIIVVYLVKNAISILCSYIKYRYTFRLRRETSTLMLKSYLQRPYEFFLNTNSAEMIRGIDSDTASLNHILLDTFGIFSETITIMFISIYLFKKDAIIASLSLLLALVCFSAVTIGFKKKIKEAGIQTRNAIANQNKYSYQAINGIKEITVLDRRDYFSGKYEDAAKELEKAHVTNNVVSACPDRILEGVCISGFMAIICFRIIINPNLVQMLPVLGSFAMGTFKILPSIAKISNHFNQLVYNQFGLSECYDNITKAREIIRNRDLLEDGKEYTREVCGDVQLFSDKLEIKDVYWKYSSSKGNVLDGINLEINRGESVAFVGPSGAGKTTLADVIMGLLKPQSGQVLVDGIDIFTIPRRWAKTIGYVPQVVFLTDDTIKSNVAFGIPQSDISDEKVYKALEQAQLMDLIKQLPNGISTVVGERGTKLSGGQRQRLAIARALYDDPDILVLDEATSALDNETESAVMEAIELLSGKKTLIIVAHRMTTVKNCNRAYRISGGKALEVLVEDLL